MAASISGRAVRVPDDVLMRELDGESVLVHLDSEACFGLDDVGTRMWALLTSAPLHPGRLRGAAGRIRRGPGDPAA